MTTNTQSGVVKVQRITEGTVSASYVVCPVCENRITLVDGYAPKGANVEQLFRETLDVHVANHKQAGETRATFGL